MIKRYNPQVAIIILNWNGKADTLECLESVYQLDYPNFKVIVVDNGSEDDSVESVREAFPHATVIENGANLGFAAGNNVGIRYALENGADYIWLLNNDTTVEPDSLTKLVAYAEAHPSVGMLNPLIMNFNNHEAIDTAGGWIDWETGRAVSYKNREAFDALPMDERCLSGCALMVKRKVIERIGLLDERYFFFGEDRDWSIRCTENGYDLAVIRKAKVYHKVSRSIGFASPQYWYQILRSRFLLMEKFRRRFGWAYRLKFTALCVELHQKFQHEGAPDASRAVLDALFWSVKGIPFIRSESMRKFFEKLVKRHPYFLYDLFAFQFRSIAQALRKRMHARFYN